MALKPRHRRFPVFDRCSGYRCACSSASILVARTIKRSLDTSRLEEALARAPNVRRGPSRTDRRNRIECRVHGVHSIQGMEAEAVILVFRAGRGAKADSRARAGATPNRLNAGATRGQAGAVRGGQTKKWQPSKVLAVGAETRDARPARDWLSPDCMAPAE